ncbi:MAG: S-layer homology domain-containing protein, partial [Coleofasciculaceae cyanobacterium]
VVNYPSLTSLNPVRNATRAEVAAFLYQAMVKEGAAQAIASSFIVDPTPVATNFTIPAGATIPVKYEKDKILVTKDETVPLTLTVDRNITTNTGTVLIPVGSQIIGELRPASGGSQFVAKTLVMNGQQMSLTATSDVITKTETVRKGINIGNIAKNAALGTAAAAAISAVTGDRAIATEELLLGGGAGAIVTLIQNFIGRNSIDLVSITPGTDLNLQLGSPLEISVNR